MKKKNQNVRFVRIRGRIVPIRQKNKKKVSAVTSGAGAAIAIDALNTKRIYQNGDITIDNKRFSPQPNSFKVGSQSIMKKNGKKIGRSFFSRTGIFSEGDFSFGFISIKKSERRKGYSKILSKESVREIRRQGGNNLINQVIHKGSLHTNYNRKRDKLWKSTDGVNFSGITKKQALKNLLAYKKNGIKGGSDVFRETKISGIHRKTKYSNPFRTKSNKARIAIGTLMAVGGAFSLLKGESK